jgi:hypothetical protein
VKQPRFSDLITYGVKRVQRRHLTTLVKILRLINRRDAS